MPNDGAVRRPRQEPAHRVVRIVIDRDLGPARIGEAFRRHDAPSLEAAVPELQANPARHVLDGGIEVAGRAEVIRKNRIERHLDGCVGRPAVAFRVIGRRLDRLGGEARLRHPQRVEQLAAGDRVPIGRTGEIAHHPPRQQVGHVGIGEGGAEARHRLDVAQGAD
jgi:hypothetical protein